MAGLCAVVGAVGSYHRNLDNVMLVPALLASWRLTLQRPRVLEAPLTVLMALSVWTPQRLLDALPGRALGQSLIWVLLGIRLLAELVSLRSGSVCQAADHRLPHHPSPRDSDRRRGVVVVDDRLPLPLTEGIRRCTLAVDRSNTGLGVAPRRCALLLLLPLAGCGPRPPFEVQTLADAGLKPLPAAQLQACAAKLRLPPELPRPADATNFGVRQRRDAFGREVPHQPQLIVLHETVISAADTARRFATPHPRDDDQTSYHLLLDRAGQRLRIVPDAGRAFGAGMAAFGDFTVRIRPGSVGSLNNVALHLSLESPPDGRGDGDAHSGYTPEQYRVAAGQVLLWQAAFGIPISRVTTHQAVDRSHSRRDPRSFRWEAFDAAWRQGAQRCGLKAYDRGRATL